ncbi:MAG: transcriptional activator RfaH [Sphingomonadales bacterium]|nr:transcriptional activator RfaH [Sphingomonadales bacterium]
MEFDVTSVGRETAAASLALPRHPNPGERRARWYVVETLPRKEMLAHSNLQMQHFKCFLPRYRKTRRHARKVDTVLAPLFPNYMFVELDTNLHSWRRINGTYGVKQLVGSEANLPTPMPSTAMQLLMDRCPNGTASNMASELQVGQKVKLSCGPFADMIGMIERIGERDRITILMNLLGSNVCVSMTADYLLPA